MNKLLVFLVLCIASASCVELENLCSSDHFEYNGVLVNSFYKSRLNVTFPSLSYYLINSSITCDRSEFVNKTNFLEAIKIKNNFNRKFPELYTNDLNDATAEELGEKRYEVSKYWSPLYRMIKVEPTSKCVETFERMIYSAYNLIETLEWVVNRNSYPVFDEAGFKPRVLDIIKTQEKLFEKLNNAGDGQTFALKDKTAFDVYFKWGFVLRKEFKFLTEGSVQPDTESLLTHDQYLPFNNPHHSDKDCVLAKELPQFYKNKGKK